MSLRAGIVGLVALGVPFLLEAQTPVTRAARTITEADIRRRINLIADDSMGGRNTPSPGLTKTALYIAAEFKRLGLRPGGDSGRYLLSYPIIQKRILPESSIVRFRHPGGAVAAELTFAQGAAWAGRGLNGSHWKGGVVLVGGTGGLDGLSADLLRNNVVVYLTDWSQFSATARYRQLAGIVARTGATGLVAVVNSDSVFTARYGAAASRVYQTVGDGERGPFGVAVREGALVAQHADLAQLFDSLRRATSLAVQPMPGVEAEVAVRDTTISLTSAPDVVGILPGSDPRLRSEYVVFSAHMDHVGTTGQPGAMCGAMGADSICNGADDDGSGTVGVLELAEAFSQKGARPKRSMIFLTVSGEEHGLWGSEWFVNHPPVAIRQIVADLNADMIGRNWKDTIVAIGKEHSDLGATLNRVNGAHPELSMHAIDDRWPEQNFYRRSDHFNFATKGVPILFFFNGTHPDYHRPSDSPDKIDAEKESRIVKLLFYVGQDVANAPERPKWVPESYKEIVTP